MDCSAAFIGSPLKFNELITVYPPKVRDVIEEPKFNLYKSILTTTQEDIEDMITGAINGEFRELAPDETIPTPYAFLIANAHANKEYEERLKSAFYFFTHSNLTILAEQGLMLVGNLEDIVKNITSLHDLSEYLLLPEDFFRFQNTIRIAAGLDTKEPPNPNLSNKIRLINAKNRYRERQANIHKKGIELSTTLISICCMGIGITPLNIGEIPYMAALKLVSAYQSKEKYENDMNIILAGGDPNKVKPKYWIRDINNDTDD